MEQKSYVFEFFIIGIFGTLCLLQILFEEIECNMQFKTAFDPIVVNTMEI
jgi:hypothetical protein